MRRALGFAAFFLLGGLLLATHLRAVLAPEHPPLTTVQMPHGWMATPAPAVRGYFRHRLDVPFEPRHAWIAIAAEDYRLYVNGAVVGANSYLLRAGTAFQDRSSARAQSFTRDEVFPRGGGAQSAKAAKREWRMVHFHDLTPHLERGSNTIALAVQSSQRNRAALFGSVTGDGLEMGIPGHAHRWLASTEGQAGNDASWFEPAADDLGWTAARSEQAPQELPLYATADPAIWQLPFRPAPIASTDTGAAGEHLLATELPSEPGGGRGWLRAWSSARYDLFLDEQWVGEGAGGNAVDAHDLSPFLAHVPARLSVRLQSGAPDARQPSGWIALDGRIGTHALSTSSGWQALAGFHPQWLRGAGAWVEAVAQERSAAPGEIVHQRAADHGWSRTGAWFGSGLMLAAALAALSWGLAFATRRAADDAAATALARGCWLLTPALLGILAVQALRWRFAESDSLLMFVAPGVGPLWLATGPLLLLVTLLWLRPGMSAPGRRVQRPPALHTLLAPLARVAPSIWLASVCLLALALRWIGLEHQPPSGDDYTSWEAARGILREGLPRAASGIVYTRSPLFHYALAGWMSVFGDGLASVRSFSLLPSVGTVAASYFLVRAITRQQAPALLTALVLALDPWLLGVTNLVRFYQLMQFFAVLSVLYFLKGFVWREGRRAQNLFFVLTTAAVLSQEIFATTLAALLLVFLVCYRPFDWHRDRNVWLGFGAMLLVIWLDLRTFSTVSLTPHVALSSRSEPLLVPHLTDAFGGATAVLTQLATDFFWLHNGDSALWTALFAVGLVYWARKADAAMLTLYAIVLVTIPLLSVLVVPVNARYAYALYPMFVAAAVITAWAIARDMADPASRVARLLGVTTARRGAGLAAGILIATYLVGAEFDKLAGGYHATREIDYRRAWDYVAERRLPGDKTMAVRTPGAGVTFGSADYYMMVGPSFDGLYQRRDGIVDRWSGGKLVWKVDQLREVLLRNERVWVVVDELRLPNMLPDYVAFLNACCRVQSEFFGGQVLLWERSAGRFHTAPDQGSAVDSF